MSRIVYIYIYQLQVTEIVLFLNLFDKSVLSYNQISQKSGLIQKSELNTTHMFKAKTLGLLRSFTVYKRD